MVSGPLGHENQPTGNFEWKDECQKTSEMIQKSTKMGGPRPPPGHSPAKPRGSNLALGKNIILDSLLGNQHRRLEHENRHFWPSQSDTKTNMILEGLTVRFLTILQALVRLQK